MKQNDELTLMRERTKERGKDAEIFYLNDAHVVVPFYVVDRLLSFVCFRDFQSVHSICALSLIICVS